MRIFLTAVFFGILLVGAARSDDRHYSLEEARVSQADRVTFLYTWEPYPDAAVAEYGSKLGESSSLQMKSRLDSIKSQYSDNRKLFSDSIERQAKLGEGRFKQSCLEFFDRQVALSEEAGAIIDELLTPEQQSSFLTICIKNKMDIKSYDRLVGTHLGMDSLGAKASIRKERQMLDKHLDRVEVAARELTLPAESRVAARKKIKPILVSDAIDVLSGRMAEMSSEQQYRYIGLLGVQTSVAVNATDTESALQMVQRIFSSRGAQLDDAQTAKFKYFIDNPRSR